MGRGAKSWQRWLAGNIGLLTRSAADGYPSTECPAGRPRPRNFFGLSDCRERARKKPVPSLLALVASTLIVLSGCGGTGSGGSSSPSTDLDGDGVINSLDAFPDDPAASVDTDGDGQPDDWNSKATPQQVAASQLVVDEDDDNDGIPDGQDAFPKNSREWRDNDGDGLGDNADADDDNDGIPDDRDAFPKDADEWADNDGDGIGNGADPDNDNDGVDDEFDAFPVNPNEWADNDRDGVGDNADTDDDNDGVPDDRDAFPTQAVAVVDNDGDGRPDTFLPGATQAQIEASGLTLDDDDDNDGVLDTLDTFPLDPAESADRDGDGVGNNQEQRVRAAAGAVLMGSLANVPVPEPANLGLFLRASADGTLNADGFPNVDPAARAGAIQLGKALFWDMQVGSDGQACGSCHFNAGADTRTRNQLNPGIRAGNTTFGFSVGATPPGWGPGYALTAADFPFHKLADPELEDFTGREVLFDTDDVASSQGVFNALFSGNAPSDPFDLGTSLVDEIFNLAGVNTRRVEPRNTPTMINAVFNFTNFWDGRAHPYFNGETVIGPLDDQTGVWIEEGGVLNKIAVEIPNASLASQAVGPPLSTDEMSFADRTFPDIGRKLLGLQPLGQQAVHPGDSVLGALADPADGKGLTVSYADLVQAAFQPKYWSSAQPVALPEGEFTQMEANFALFFGLAVQMYEATLVSDRTPFDRFMEGDDAGLGPAELQGLKVFMNVDDPTQLPGGQFADLFAGVSRGFCSACHAGPEFTSHSTAIAGAVPIELDFVAQLVDGLLVPTEPLELTFQDEGMYNIGVRPSAEDPGRGGTENGLPLSFTRQAIGGLGLPFATLPAGDPEFPGQLPVDNRASTLGAFKVPGLRNVELTGPYFHNGGQATLAEVLEFYQRHGDFSDVNLAELDGVLAKVQLAEDDEEALVAFMLALTDQRVRYERAPFDHPQLIIPAGDGRQGGSESFLELSAVGAGGRATPLKPFLNLDQLTGRPLP